MAENETPDIRVSRRWWPVIRLLAAGGSDAEVAAAILAASLKVWKAVSRQLGKIGITFEKLTQAVAERDQAFLDRAYKASGHHRFVRWIEAAGGPMIAAPEVMSRAIDRLHLHVEQQVRDHLVGKGLSGSIEEATRKVSSPFRLTRGLVIAWAPDLAGPGKLRAADLLRQVPPALRPSPAGTPAMPELLNRSLLMPSVRPPSPPQIGGQP